LAPEFHGTLEILLVALFLKSANLFRGHGLLSGAALEDKQTQGPDLELLRVRIFQLGCGTDFAAEGAFHDRFEGGFAADGEGFRFDQEVVGQIQRGFHMGENMVLRLAVNTRAVLSNLSLTLYCAR
jgi:hypothetical protein